MVRFGFLQGWLADTGKHSEVIRIYEIRDFNIFVSFAFFLWDHFLDQFFNLECEISKFAMTIFQTVKWLPSSSCSQILKRFGPIGQIPGLGLHSWSGSSSLELVPQKELDGIKQTSKDSPALNAGTTLEDLRALTKK